MTPADSPTSQPDRAECRPLGAGDSAARGGRLLRYHRARPGRTAALLLALACGGEGRSTPRTPAAAAPPSAAPAAADTVTLPASGGAAGARTETVPLTAQVTLGGQLTSFAGPGQCHHTADASIYQVPASQWAARVQADTGALRYLNLTLWQPRGETEIQVSLAVTVGESTHRISTVKGGELHGTARGVIEPGGAGGTLKVDGRDPDGRTIALTVQCSRFTEPVAEGG